MNDSPRTKRETDRSGRRAKPLSITLSPDLDEEVRGLAEQQNVTIARVMDTLLRRALTAKALEASRSLVADRLESVLLRLDTYPFGNTAYWAHPLEEQRLLGAAILGGDEAMTALNALKPEVFAYDVHCAAWTLLSDRHVVPGLGSVEKIADILQARFPTIGEDLEHMRPLPTYDYFEKIVHAAELFPDSVPRSVAAVVDAHRIRRRHTDWNGAEPSGLNEAVFLLAQRTGTSGANQISLRPDMIYSTTIHGPKPSPKTSVTSDEPKPTKRSTSK